MTTPAPYEVTQLLAAASEGDSHAAAQLLPQGPVLHQARKVTHQPCAVTRFAQQGCSTQRLDKGSDSAAEHLETLVGGVGIRGVSRHCGLNHGEPLLK